MANRIYLYSIDKLPAKGKKVQVKDALEWSWDIPLVFATLLSSDTRSCNSLIWKGAKALVGDYQKGLSRLKVLIELFLENNVQHKEVFNRVSQENLKFFNSSKLKQKYFLLETHEITDNSEVGYLIKDFKYVGDCIDNRDFESLNTHIGHEDIRSKWEELLGLADYFELPNYLYVSFNDSVDLK